MIPRDCEYFPQKCHFIPKHIDGIDLSINMLPSVVFLQLPNILQ